MHSDFGYFFNMFLQFSDISGESPIITRQQFTDKDNDLNLICGLGKVQFYNTSKNIEIEHPIDFQTISFLSDGRSLNASLWLNNDLNNIFNENSLPNGTVQINDMVLLQIIKIDPGDYNDNISQIIEITTKEIVNRYNNNSVSQNPLIHPPSYGPQSFGDLKYYKIEYFYEDNLRRMLNVNIYWFYINDNLYVFLFSGLAPFYYQFEKNTVNADPFDDVNLTLYEKKIYDNFLNKTWTIMFLVSMQLPIFSFNRIPVYGSIATIANGSIHFYSFPWPQQYYYRVSGI